MVAVTLGKISFYIVVFSLYIFGLIDMHLIQIFFAMAIIFAVSYFFYDDVIAIFAKFAGQFATHNKSNTKIVAISNQKQNLNQTKKPKNKNKKKN